MSESSSAIKAIERLKVPQGRLAGKRIKLAEYQRQFIEGALAPGVSVGVWSIGRGNAKTATSAALAVGHLIGMWGKQEQREIIVAARTKDQAAIAFRYAQSYLETLPKGMVTFERIHTREHPHFSLRIDAADGPHELKAISADGKSALGGSPTFVVADERAAWRAGRGEEMEASLLTGLGKRDGRMLIISTSAPDDANAFSQWCDNPPSACYVQEHRPPPNLEPDDYDSLMIANPGSLSGIGAKPAWLIQQAQQAAQRGGAALAAFRNLHRNERVAASGRDVLIQVDDWLKCECHELPPRRGKVIIGLDLGGAASMTASAFFWPETNRLEVRGWFPSKPDLLARGHSDHVGNRYQDMAGQGHLKTVGDQSVPVRQWISETIEHIGDSPIEAIVADRFKQAEVGEALAAESVSARIVWRGMGWRDGAEDVRRFQRAVVDRQLCAEQSLLMRSALADCVVALDESGNGKLSKARSTGRIDPVAAAVLAVAEASRLKSRPVRAIRAPVWA